MRTTFTLAQLTRSLLHRRSGHTESPSTAADPDPFATLAVQVRLSRVAAELRRLEGSRWAVGHHLTAAMMAYDDLLAEAAVLSGIDVPDGSRSVRRFVLEAQLQAAGWNW